LKEHDASERHAFASRDVDRRQQEAIDACRNQFVGIRIGAILRPMCFAATAPHRMRDVSRMAAPSTTNLP
jgi:hypothetical protein